MYVFLEHSSMKTYSSRTQKQKQEFVKEHNIASKGLRFFLIFFFILGATGGVL